MAARWFVDKSADELWEIFTRPEDLVARVPAIISVSEKQQGGFNLVVNVDTGLGWSVYEFVASLEYGTDERSLTINAVGVSRQQVVDFTTKFAVSETAGGALIDFSIDAVARGCLASVGQRTVQWVVAQQVQNWIAQAVRAPLRTIA